MPYGPVDKVGIKDEGEVKNPRTGKPVKPKAFGGPESNTSRAKIRASSWSTG